MNTLKKLKQKYNEMKLNFCWVGGWIDGWAFKELLSAVQKTNWVCL